MQGQQWKHNGQANGYSRVTAYDRSDHMLMDDIMMSFHHNGAYIIDSLRNDDNLTGTTYQNPFPLYNYGTGSSRETFEFECNINEDQEELETIQIDPE